MYTYTVKNGKIMRTLISVLILLSICVVNSVAYAADITRTKALALIQKAGVDPYKVEVPIDSEVAIDMLLAALPKNRSGQMSVAYRCLDELGYLKLKKNRDGFDTYSVTVTDKATRIGKPIKKKAFGYHTFYVFKIADRLPRKVVGIRKTGYGSALALFKWKLGNFNEVFRCMVPNHTPYTKVGEAELVKYDDGWRVEEVRKYRKKSR